MRSEVVGGRRRRKKKKNSFLRGLEWERLVGAYGGFLED
jgi:hypothetical protein